MVPARFSALIEILRTTGLQSVQFESCKISKAKLKEILEVLAQDENLKLRFLRLIDLDGDLFISPKVKRLLTQIGMQSLEIRSIQLD